MIAEWRAWFLFWRRRQGAGEQRKECSFEKSGMDAGVFFAVMEDG
jgi:hypothetical protein